MIYCAVALCLGIIISPFLKVPTLFYAISGGASAITAVFLVKHRVLFLTLLSLGTFFLGILSYNASSILPPEHIARHTFRDGDKVALKGTVVDDPVTRPAFYGSRRTTCTVDIDAVRRSDSWHRASGLARVQIYSKKGEKWALSFGDLLMLEGTLSRPAPQRNPYTFDYARYLALRDIYTTLSVKDSSAVRIIGTRRLSAIEKISYAIRQNIKGAVDRHFRKSGPDNGFLKAILIGERVAFKRSLEDDFTKTGTIHILSISGTHVGLIAGMLLFVFAAMGLPKKPGIVLALLSLAFYTLAAGASPPIIRSTIMFSIFGIGYLIDREGDILNSLALAAIIILAWNPKALFDPGFQLSFASVGSIILISPRIDTLLGVSKFRRNTVLLKLRFFTLKSVSVSMAAWIGVAPIVAFYFNITSPISVVSNVVVIPLVSVIMAASFAFLSFGCLSSPCASLIALFIEKLDHILFVSNHLLAMIPGAYARIPAPSPWFMAAYYLLLSLFLAPPIIDARLIRIRRDHLIVAASLFLGLSVCMSIFSGREGQVKITFFDVGQGDSALIEFPGKRAVLIDAGSGARDEDPDMGRSVIAPYLWNKNICRLDAVIITHFHRDHLGGMLYILKNFDVGLVIDNGARNIPRTSIYKKYMRILKDRRMDRRVAREGDRIRIADGAKLHILNPPREGEIDDSNDNSIVFKLTHQNSSVLFCGDISKNAIRRMIGYGKLLRADIMKIPHHGSGLGDEKEVKSFFDLVSPEISVVSARRPVSLPLTSRVFETRESGAISVIMEKNSYGVEEFREKN